MRSILELAKNSSQLFSQIYEELHMNAETGFDLAKTTAIVSKYLNSFGIENYTDGKYVFCDIGDKTAPATLLRADMDALPMREESGVPFSSQTESFHGCGHDMHTSMLLGAAKLLKENEKQLTHRVRLLFQPAEEILKGAEYVINQGVLDGVKNAVMIHVMTAVPFETGTVIVSSGGVSAPAVAYFTVKVKGQGGHGSSPQLCVDPISTACRIVTALDELSSREFSSFQPFTLTVGEIHGGNAHNVIPNEVIFRGTVRCYDEAQREELKFRICEISENIACAFRAQAEVAFDSDCPSLLNDGEVSDKMQKILVSNLGKEKVFTSAEISKNSKLSSGSEDFAFISRKVPSVMMGLSAGSVKDGFEYPLHNPKVTFDKDAISYGAAVYYLAGTNLLD